MNPSTADQALVTEAGNLALETPLWDFALHLWKNQDVQTILLAEQDQQGARINPIIAALWLGKLGQNNRSILNEAQQKSLAWHEHYVIPTRLMRQSLSGKQSLSGQPSSTTGLSPISALHSHYKQAELLAEQIELAMLFKSLKPCLDAQPQITHLSESTQVRASYRNLVAVHPSLCITAEAENTETRIKNVAFLINTALNASDPARINNYLRKFVDQDQEPAP